MAIHTNSHRRRIFLTRHGAVQYIAEDRKLSAHKNVQLTEKGHEQAETLKAHLNGVSFDRVFSSPLERCLETATLVSGVPREKMTVLRGIREMEPGNISDIPRQKLATACIDVFDNLSEEDAFFGGETFGALTDRVTKSIDEILNAKAWETCLVVAHEVVNRAILAHALSVDVSAFNQLEQEECALNILDVSDDGHFIVRLMNYMAYNPLSCGHSSRSMERLAAALV